MADKEILMLSDKEIIPTDEYIFSIIGEKKILWQNLMQFVSENHKDFTGTWNYYNDGKQWLFKMVWKKKTIFWATILQETFKITFYFGDKAESKIIESDLPQSVKDDFKTTRRYGKIRAISTKIFNASDLELIKKLILLKMEIK
jgi:hypothetical protein